MEQQTGERRGIRSLAPRVPASVRRDYATSMAVDAVTLGSGLLVFHLVARRTSVDGFAYYQVARGLISTLQPVAMIGLVVGLQRYLPRAGAGIRSLARRAFLVQAAAVTVTGVLGCALAPDIAELLGISGGVEAVQVIFVALAGTCLWFVSIGALRGGGHVTAANVSWLLGLGVIPIAAFLVAHDIAAFLALQGILMAGLAVVGVAMTGRCATAATPTVGAAPSNRPAPTLRSLVRYGIRRTPGDVALPALFAFPTFYAASAVLGGSEAGYVGFTTSAIMLICSAFGMLTPVLLPRLSSQLAGPAVAPSVWLGLRALPLVAATLAVAATVVLALAAPPIVRGFLGDEFGAAVPILRLGLLASIPLAVFYAARPTLDALQDAPVTVKLLIGCFGLEVLVTYVAGRFVAPASAALLGLVVAATALGALSYVALLAAVRRATATSAATAATVATVTATAAVTAAAGQG